MLCMILERWSSIISHSSSSSRAVSVESVLLGSAMPEAEDPGRRAGTVTWLPAGEAFPSDPLSRVTGREASGAFGEGDDTLLALVSCDQQAGTIHPYG